MFAYHLDKYYVYADDALLHFIQEAWLKLFWTHQYDELEPCVSQCVSLSSFQQMDVVAIHDILFFLGYLII